jgi:hypothetical protein
MTFVACIVVQRANTAKTVPPLDSSVSSRQGKTVATGNQN